MYLVINKCVTAVKVSNFSGHYLRNHWTLDIGVLGYIGIVWPKEHSPEVWHIPPGTSCIIRFCVRQVHTSFYKTHKPTINSLALLDYCNLVISRNVPLSVKFISCHPYQSAGRYGVLTATSRRNAQHRRIQFCSKVLSGLSQLCDLEVRKCTWVVLGIYHSPLVLVIPAFHISQFSSHFIRQ